MKKYASATILASLTTLFVLCLLPGVSDAQSYRLFGISGKQQADQVAPGVYTNKDHTLFEINTGTALLTEKIRMTWVPDSDAIAFCSKNGLLYHTASSGAYRDNRAIPPTIRILLNKHPAPRVRTTIIWKTMIC